ncbi:hypothetical protein BDFB_004053 [Asbolus verrucosus]|uniref:Uncharacterized protein n=1 Tax=Asbolus verrucosus TaxID=1661398 RepID=A0A482VRN9_ASBVE|nr:hypothetical protein BDFB_004053 [Asbolus verrucosus]
MMMNDTITTPFDFGPLLYSDDLRFTAPTPKKLKSYRKLFVVFKVELWKKIFTAMGVVMVIFYILKLCEDSDKTSLFAVMFDVFRVSICSSVNILPKRTSLRILLIFFSLFSLNIDSVYLSKLSNIFAFTNYDINVKNLEAADNKQLKFVVNWQVERCYLLMYVTRNAPGAKKRLFFERKSQSYFLNHTALAKENGTVLFTSLLDAHPSENALLDHFHVMTAYMTFFVTFYLRKNHPFNEAITFWAEEIVEKGFVVKWFDDIRRSNRRNEILPEEEEKLIVLKLAHFEESFRILIGGYGLGFVTFLLEFVFKKLEMIGFVQSVKDNIIFLLGLLKPPTLQENK